MVDTSLLEPAAKHGGSPPQSPRPKPRDVDSDEWFESLTPGGSKFRYTLIDGSMDQIEMVCQEPPKPVWNTFKLKDGRTGWQKKGTAEISFVDPNKTSGQSDSRPVKVNEAALVNPKSGPPSHPFCFV